MSDQKNPIFESYASHAKDNELEIVESNQCGCYFCRHMFSAREISDWVNEGRHVSAVCPECGMDCVIGDKSGVPLSKELLKSMNLYFYGEAKGVDEESAMRYCARYINGKITHKETIEALFRDYLSKLSEKGNQNAILQLAMLEETGGEFGVPDFQKAEQLYLSPALKTNCDALTRLASLYLSSEDASIRQKAYSLAAKASALGDPTGIYIIADCILSGIGVEQDVDLAYAIIDNAYQDYFDSIAEVDERELNCFANFAYRLAKYNQYGIATEKDLDFALKLYLFAKLACLNYQELGYGKALILPDIEKEINEIAAKENFFHTEPVFDSNMFFDSFSFVQEEDSKKHIHIVSYSQETGELTFEITYDKPVALIDAETLSCLMRVGTVSWTFANIAFFQGEDGDFTRVGSNDGESWIFYDGDIERMKIRYKNGKTEGVDDDR